jgi:hypothetical protein
LPLIWVHAYDEYPKHGYAVQAVVAAMYAAAVPFYMGLYKAWRLLSLIDSGKAFSRLAVKSLRFIGYCAAAISLIYAFALPFFYVWADRTDAPGLMVIGMVLVGAPLVASVSAAVLQRLLHEAIVIKSENDLTV